MKNALLIFLLISHISFGQNKKEQIEMLTEKIDSTEKVCTSQIKSLRDSINSLHNDISILQKQVRNLKGELEKSQTQQRKLQLSFDSITKANKNVKILALETENKYVGSYEFAIGDGSGEDEYSRIGSLQLFSKNNGVYFFTLEYNIGAPSYNMGSLNGSFRVYGDKGVYTANVNGYYSDENNSEDEEICKIIFSFDENGVYINQITSDTACGFGGNVIVNDYFNKVNSQNNPIDTEGIIHSTNDW